jgi:hypothetical protein
VTADARADRNLASVARDVRHRARRPTLGLAEAPAPALTRVSGR